jgi:hypothetical protein
MNELNSINNSIKALEKLLYGRNYEIHFQFEIVCESTDIEKASSILSEKYKSIKLNLQEFVQISFTEFKGKIISHCQYKGNSSHGPEFNKAKLGDLEIINNKLWQLIEQKLIPSHTLVYRIPDLQTWIYWDFSFLLVSKERNKIYLFEGGASD